MKAQKFWHMGFVLQGMWDLPGQGIEPVSPALASGFLSTSLPGKSPTSPLVFKNEETDSQRQLRGFLIETKGRNGDQTQTFGDQVQTNFHYNRLPSKFFKSSLLRNLANFLCTSPVLMYALSK